MNYLASTTNGSSPTLPIQKDLYTKARFPGRLVILGCGSIAQGVIPMLLHHTDITPERMLIISAEEKGKVFADRYNIPFVLQRLTKENYAVFLKEQLKPTDFVLNVSVDVSTEDVVAFCQEFGVPYVDTATDVWPGIAVDPHIPLEQRTNFYARRPITVLRASRPKGPTAVLSHGANPGLVSHFIKQALLNIATDTGEGIIPEVPKDREGWARLMYSLKIRAVHISERDTQYSPLGKRPDEFVNTWSVDALLDEAAMPAELGWGTHEKDLPIDGHEQTHDNNVTVYLDRPGALTQVRSWTPREGPFHGYLITHEECVSTSDYYTLVENGAPIYRPTVLFAYHPCDDAVLSLREYAWNNWKVPHKKRILGDDIESGSEELGVLLMGHKKRSYWYGSDLSIAQVRELVSNQNATALQVTASALAAVIWALENPGKGILEPEDLDFRRVLEIATPYLGIVHGKYTNWTPLRDRKEPLFPEEMSADPWQFKNFRVM